MLHFIRREAADVLQEIARSYREQFDRPLPITSLVRTEQYQKQLSRTRPNAAHVKAAPHTTGLAFDIYDNFMTAAEQSTLMRIISDLEGAGRVEALKERDHIHVFVFAGGKPPREELIADSIDLVGVAKAKAHRPKRPIRKAAADPPNGKRTPGQAGG
jgi:hypothetical protein